MAPRPRGETYLCYLDAAEVRISLSSLSGMELLGSDGHRVGHVKGVLIDPRSCRLRYLVLDPATLPGRCFLVSTDALIRLGPQQRTLHVESVSAR